MTPQINRPSWHGHETIPITDKAGMAAPWNTPTAGTLKKGESKAYRIRLTMADAGPRTRNNALLKAGRSVLNAVPGTCDDDTPLLCRHAF